MKQLVCCCFLRGAQFPPNKGLAPRGILPKIKGAQHAACWMQTGMGEAGVEQLKQQNSFLNDKIGVTRHFALQKTQHFACWMQTGLEGARGSS